MSEQSTPSQKLQWKWVGITIVMYAVFYLLPLFLLAQSGGFLAGAWVFAGIIIIAAVAGYISKGVTIWEPAIAGGGLMFLFFLCILILLPSKVKIFQAAISMTITVLIVFLMSLFGAWLGERAQKLWKKESPSS